MSVSALDFSEADTNRLYERVIRQIQPLEVISPDKKHTAVYWQTHPGIYGKNCSHIIIRDKTGKIMAEHNLRDHGGRLVAVAHWSPDSRFCIFTTISAGGHSPWQFEPYIYSAADKRFRFLGDSLDAVINPEFRFEPPSTVLFATRQGNISLKSSSLISTNVP